ncbi:protein phosphatase 2C domain-containing protein [Bradyrhizobium sp. NBAIM20]|uniref:PP2C family serine/threonine-protein phosphatase n=1 Tax=unclassified Bradyrhizobium TaxID=2631580 RepID=UPI001CD1C249|nr:MULTISPECIES: PP2C family serine/threonine-protein phosphatase [unclassified Bradyrhizobium]MCA1416331.1 protein phosphatase 2C domain-containing protein [Bradyrhizobium sp. NBAIM20]MCA1466109.1 protein phosphatase 2C domain-containing protein [Bradyrhizobium sp. NBAIM18]
MSWKAAAQSVLGNGHLKANIPCQDASECLILDDGRWLVGAIADGGGSLTHSDIGAQIAVRYSIISLTAVLRSGLLPAVLDTEREGFFDGFWSDLVHDIRSQLMSEAELSDSHFSQYGATLIAFVACEDWLAAMQIGDGFLVLSADPAGTEASYNLAFKARPSEHVGEVTWITSSHWREDFRQGLFPGLTRFVCASSDGLEKVAILQREQIAFPGFFRPLHTTAMESSDSLLSVAESTLTLPALDRFTDDDKSLLIGLRIDG